MKKKRKYLLIIAVIFLVMEWGKLPDETYAKIMDEYPDQLTTIVNHAKDSALDLYEGVDDEYREEDAEIYQEKMQRFVDEIKALRGSEPKGLKKYHKLYLKSVVNYQEAINVYAKSAEKNSMDTQEYEEFLKYIDLGEQFTDRAREVLQAPK